MRLLITGASGFVGRNLLPYLQEMGYEIYCIVKDDGFLYDFDEYLKTRGINAKIITCDITDQNKVRMAVDLIKPEAAIHMAALASVEVSWIGDMWMKYITVNYFGTVNLVNALSSIKDFRLLIYYSTPEIFKPQNTSCTENSHVYPTSPYSISKAAAEFYVMAQYDVPTIVVRPANSYDRSILYNNLDEVRRYFIEKAIVDSLTKRKVEFNGSPDSIRTWMHISDHVSAILMLLSYGFDSKIKHHDVFNIAPPGCTASCGSVFGTIALILKDLGFIKSEDDIDVTWENNPRPYDPPILAVDGSKFIGKFPKWKPLPLVKGLEKAILNWMKVLKT